VVDLCGLKTPEEFFGFEPGSEKKLIRWDMIVDYYRHLAKESNRIKVEDRGESTMGNPMILAYISSEKNLSRLDELRAESWAISHPRDLSDVKAERVIKSGRVVVGLTMSIHASEVGGTQLSPELAFELITGEDTLTKSIRENVVIVLVPCANPDGQIMSVDWYRKWLGTEYEGCGLPWLYHKYAGHDNNRDALTLTQVETKIMNRVFLKEWFPQAYLDTHQMGFFGARFFIPPNSNPVNEVVDPLVWVEQRHYGAQMMIRMESAGIHGVETAATFPSDFMPGFSLVFPWFGICGMFTESASAKFATPVYVHYHQLGGTPRGRPEYRAQVNFLHPWKGGWWTLRNIIDGQKTAVMATLEVAANNREMILRNMLSKSLQSLERGASEAPYAFIVPSKQWDGLTALKLLRTLRELSVEVQVAEVPFKVGDASYPEGSYVISCSQTARPFVISLLDRTWYRDSLWVRTQDGTPMMNYDFATQTMAEFKGVDVVRVDEPLLGKFRELDKIEAPVPKLRESKNGYLIDPRFNDAFRAVNMLLREGVEVKRVDEPIIAGEFSLPAGAFYIHAKGKVVLRKVSEEMCVPIVEAGKPAWRSHCVEKLRVAIYQRYYGGNMDEGWTRWLLEQYGFEYTTVKDAEVKEGLAGKFDVLILPSDAPPFITGEKLDEFYDKRFKGVMTLPLFPPEYLSGIKQEGVTKIKEFVETGGTLLCLNESIDFAIENLKVPVSNPLKDMKSQQFHCPGSTLWVDIDNSHPIAYGMPSRGLILLRGNLVLAVKQGNDNDAHRVVVSYPEERLMQSGWLIGEEHLARKAALVESRVKEGRVILYAFAPQNRALTDATFKLFFNTLLR